MKFAGIFNIQFDFLSTVVSVRMADEMVIFFASGCWPNGGATQREL